MGKLNPADKTIPEVLSKNINQVLTDLAKSEPGRNTKPIEQGATLLAELDIKGSGGMETLMRQLG